MPPVVLPARYDDLTPEQRRAVREAYVKQQEGKCRYCNAVLHGPAAPWAREKKVTPRLYPHGFFLHRVHLHHDHGTGWTIGAVHAHCNAVLWEHHRE